MRKKLAVLLAVFTMIRVLSVFVTADYVIGSEIEGDLEISNGAYETFTPFEVDIVERASRYAVDVEYEDLSIYIKSATWDVNHYQYVVEMDNENPEFMITVYNHSDLPVKAVITPNSVSNYITFTQTYSQGEVTELILPKVNVGAGAPTSAFSTIKIQPSNEFGSWQALTNHFIAQGETRECVIGQIVLTVSKN